MQHGKELQPIGVMAASGAKLGARISSKLHLPGQAGKGDEPQCRKHRMCGVQTPSPPGVLASGLYVTSLTVTSASTGAAAVRV